MATELGDVIGKALGNAARDAAKTVASNARKTSKNGSLSGAKGVAAGAGLAMLAPLAAKGVGKLATGAKDAVGKGVSKGVDKTVDKAGGAGGIAKKAAKDAIPGMGGGDDGGNGGQKNEAEGAGKGRRMPIQQAIDVGAPLPRPTTSGPSSRSGRSSCIGSRGSSQEDETHVTFKTKIWGISKEFKAEIVEQRPDERIKWKVTDGVTHTGVVTFHELAERLTQGRGQPRRRARLADREGGSRNAPRKARGASGPGPLQGVRDEGRGRGRAPGAAGSRTAR